MSLRKLLLHTSFASTCPPVLRINLAGWSATWHRKMAPPARLGWISNRPRDMRSCGGSFRHACANKYSPVLSGWERSTLPSKTRINNVAIWMRRQAIARMPRKCLVVWLGTTGKLRKASANPMLHEGLGKNCFGGLLLCLDGPVGL